MPKTYYHYFSIHNPPCRGGLDGSVKTLTIKGLYILTTQVFLKLVFPIVRISSPRQTSKSWYGLCCLSLKCYFTATRMHVTQTTVHVDIKRVGNIRVIAYFNISLLAHSLMY